MGSGGVADFAGSSLARRFCWVLPFEARGYRAGVRFRDEKGDPRAIFSLSFAGAS